MPCIIVSLNPSVLGGMYSCYPHLPLRKSKLKLEDLHMVVLLQCGEAGTNAIRQEKERRGLNIGNVEGRFSLSGSESF